ncbi:MAG: GNAT family N-acetyltransferase [Pseudomonadota bacterium]|nr:GNAT family N-acetyltransferase [Pseudomonadota bacterium]
MCVGDVCATARFFPDLRLNYAEALLHRAARLPAILSCHAGGRCERLTRGELQGKVARLATAFARLGVKPGNRVVAITRNNAEAVIAALAAAAIGGVFSSCEPHLGASAILSCFAPLRPVVLLAALRAEPWDAGAPVASRVAEVAAALPTLAAIIALDDGPVPAALPAHRLAELTQATGDDVAAWRPFPFDHPLFVLFSSETIGAPRGIVHGAGGALVEHHKEHRLHCDLRPGERLFFQASCGSVMWNWQLSALAAGVELVLFDGPVEGPEVWRLVAEQGVTVFGTSPDYLQVCERAGFSPGRDLKLSTLRAVASTGSILYPEQYDWVREHVGPMPLQSMFGAMDILGCFFLGNPDLPVARGAAQCRSLGLDVRALPPSDQPESRVGELVCATPFPSRPLGFLDDPDGSRFRETYFSRNQGLWTQGGLVERTVDGGWVMHGRLDDALNRGTRVAPAASISMRRFEERDLQGVHLLGRRCFSKDQQMAGDAWRFTDTPAGVVPGMVAVDGDRIVASYTAWPATLYIGGEIVQGAQSRDTMTDPDYRGRGLFVKLASACYEMMQGLGYEVLYGFPNEQSYPGFVRRLNWTHIGDVAVLKRLIPGYPAYWTRFRCSPRRAGAGH